MLRTSLYGLAAAGLLANLPAHAAGDAELQALRAELAEMRSAYEKRIASLENRLKTAESKAENAEKVASTASAAAAEPSPQRERNKPLANAFNPQISVILDGVYYRDNRQGGAGELLEHMDGISHSHGEEGHDHGIERGFNLRETEIVFSSAVSPYFDANVKMTVSSGGDVELEEAYFDTRGLPAGLKFRGGKFFSGIGYQNAKHPHQWDFVDQNLAYRALLGEHGLNDTGVRAEWVPDTGNWYTLLGVEALQGKDHPFSGSGLATPTERADGAALAATTGGAMDNSLAGPRLLTTYAKFAPDLGDRHAVQFGVWAGWSRQHQEVHDHTAENPASLVNGLQGQAWLWGTDWVYKYDAGRVGGQGNLTLVAEYLRLTKDLNVAFHENDALLGERRKMVQDGFYAQATYGFLPFWKAGLRYDVTGWTNHVDGPAGRLRDMDASSRWTAALTRDLTEYSRFRLQFSRARLAVDGVRENVNELYLQYQHSLGTHGAHWF